MSSRWKPVMALAAMLACAGPVSAAEPLAGQAILRCDPGMKILAIDDKEERIGWTSDFKGEECSVTLAPGHHSLRVRFEWTAGDLIRYTKWWSGRAFQVEFDALPGKIYRLRERFLLEEPPLVVDVTGEEANLPSHGDEYKALPKTTPRELRSSILVARLPEPENVVVYLLDGLTNGIWFKGHTHELLYNRKREKLAIVEGGAGMTFSIGNAVINGNSFGHDKQRGSTCVFSRMPAYENIPGGKVLYLGNFRYETKRFGLVMSMDQDDIETARQLLREQKPELADRLEPAGYRLVRDPAPCFTPARLLLNARALP